MVLFHVIFTLLGGTSLGLGARKAVLCDCALSRYLNIM